MSFKSILVALDGSAAGQSVLSTAVAVASALEAHLEVFHVRADSKEAVPLLGEGMSGAMIEEMIDLADRESADRARDARAAYETCIGANNLQVVERGPANGVSVSWREETGREDEMVARHGRATDLIVAGRPRSDAERPSMLTLHAALFETGQPVLVAPPTAPARVGRKIAIAWNGSAESARAVSAAVQFLTAAEEVTALAIETDKMLGRLAPETLASHLSWHGVEIGVRRISVSQGKPVGQTLLAEAANAGADMLIMGAYTHSRVVQIILGGVTRYVLNNSEIPLFMAH
jgi:nucleotide-binding universal stress UspA family protein